MNNFRNWENRTEEKKAYRYSLYTYLCTLRTHNTETIRDFVSKCGAGLNKLQSVNQSGNQFTSAAETAVICVTYR